jgi:superfamily II DNA or RNA helicase
MPTRVRRNPENVAPSDEQAEGLKRSDTEKRLALATGRYLGEGFDDASLDTLFLSMPISWKDTLAQYVGRLHREHHPSARSSSTTTSIQACRCWRDGAETTVWLLQSGARSGGKVIALVTCCSDVRA